MKNPPQVDPQKTSNIKLVENNESNKINELSQNNQIKLQFQVENR